MSWQSWIDSMFTSYEGNVWVAEAAICGYEDGQETVWASSDGYKNITEAEIKRIRHGKDDLYQSGLYISGEKCRLLRNLLDSDEGYMYLKTYNTGQLVTVARTNKTFVIVKGMPGAPSGKLDKKLDSIVLYFMDNDL